MEWLFLIPAGYQLVALIACIRRMFQERPKPNALPPISILKPVRGADPLFYSVVCSHVQQDYPHFELLFAVASLEDPAVPIIERVIREFPDSRIRIIIRTTVTPNPKVGALIDMEKEAAFDVLLVNDGDIRVPQGYLRTLAAELAQPDTGLVTALYRARAEHLPGQVEALGVSTDFAPSTLVAPFVGVTEFAMGSTLFFRRADLRAVGGFEALGDYLADDYQLGRLITRAGKRTHLSACIVETSLGAETWREAWDHQVRWARTIRVSRGGVMGYLGLPVTFGTFWAFAAFLSGHPLFGLLLFALRFNVAVLCGLLILEDRNVVWRLSLVPLRDLAAVAVWFAGLFGDTVQWGGRRLKLHGDGRIRA
ncbi:MAG TPA: bacteriohopanetetrol glucosamine biosynthesis glycosyltransferase HpnI [Bryobacteraceae bacterium]|nr:bacteriohopanetetrol glucosamine biosynthesis glycosyltransferase HpnI [Bryobacteraceae bacterium]